MFMFFNENYRKMKEFNVVVDYVNIMWVKERGRNINMVVRVYVSLFKFYSLCLIIFGICWMMRDVMCDICDMRGSLG